MINVETAISFAAERKKGVASESEQVVDRALTDREQIQLDYLEAMIDGHLCKKYRGGIFDFVVPVDAVEPHVLQAFKASYERGGWQVGIIPRNVERKVVAWQLVFAPSGNLPEARPVTQPQMTKKLNPVARLVDAGGVKDGQRVLIRMPTRGRATKALAVLEQYRKMAGMPVMIEVVADEDDETMQTAEVVQRLAALGCTITYGSHNSKVEACNGGSVDNWDILVLASDDMVPVVNGYAVRIVEEMEKHWPHLDGALHFNDGHQRDRLCTLPVFGRRLYQMFGCVVYEPAYKSLYCDAEQTEILKQMGRLTYVDEVIIEHCHHVWGRNDVDELYARNDALGDVDKQVYELRKHYRFYFPSPKLSILICSIPERRAQCKWLVNNLYQQRHPTISVEILVDEREGITIGEKRQSLLERARGKYIVFIDDDDGIAHDYMDRVCEMLYDDFDCLSLTGVMTTAGARPEKFVHTIKSDGWFTAPNGVHWRTPNHLNVVKRELALQVGFVAKNFGEDHDYSMRLRPLLKTEGDLGDKPLYFYWYWPK